EQAKGRPVGPRSDIFSFGVLLYEMVAGKHPFARTTALETVSAILRDDPPAIPGAGPRVTAELAPILRRCLAKPPEGRYASARELADDLRRFRTAADRGDARRPWLGYAVAGVAASGLALAAWWMGARTPSPGPGTVSGRKALTVLVADFDNATGED